MYFILYNNIDGKIIQLRECANVESAGNMILHVYGDNPPAMISCMSADFQDFPQGKKVDLETGSIVDA